MNSGNPKVNIQGKTKMILKTVICLNSKKKEIPRFFGICVICAKNILQNKGYIKNALMLIFQILMPNFLSSFEFG